MLLLAASAALSGAEGGMRGWPWAGGCIGITVGAGRLASDIRDVDGFANWGNPGATLGYDAGGAVGGVLAGRRFAPDGIGLRYEVEAVLGDLSARTDGLDPTGPDEAAATHIRWAVAARFGVEEEIGRVRAFALAGPVLGRDRQFRNRHRLQGRCLEYDLRVAVAAFSAAALSPAAAVRSRGKGFVPCGHRTAALRDAWLTGSRALWRSRPATQARLRCSGRSGLPASP